MRPKKGSDKRRPARVHGDVRDSGGGAFAEVHGMVRRIPRGRVMTYGQIAGLIEHKLSPAAVGWAMHGCPDDVPWQRVVNAAGRCSTERLPDSPPGLQQALLEAEGVEFDGDSLELDRFRWHPRRLASPRK
jgi:methylated-DNA-protein-cysteine methyltransferase-like protein